MERLESEMDDLFRKAGELYPLKITESDWDAVAGKLQEENFGDLNALPGMNAIGKPNKRRWRLLLLLVPLGLAGLIYTSRLVSKQHTIPALLVVKNNAASEASKKINPANPDELIKNGNNQAGVSKTVKIYGPLNRNTQKQSKYTASMSSQRRPDLNSKNGNAKIYVASRKSESKNNIYSKNGNHETAADDLSNVNNPVADPSPYDNEEAFQILLAKSLSLTAVSGWNQAIAVNGVPLSASSRTTAPPLNNKKSNSVAQSSRGIYVGIVVGPDFSIVKFQSVKRLGFSLGAQAGYRFNKRLAVEAGLLWDKKYYYSRGEYFNKSQAGISFNILNLEGNCNMFEIPVSLRYDFVSRKNHGFFAKAGLSSYLMKKEKYSYNAETYGNAWSGDTTYYNATNNIFSIVQLSAGYELAISRKTKIRFEPYVKLPLQGVGIGSMPISSAGLYLGISHSFR